MDTRAVKPAERKAGKMELMEETAKGKISNILGGKSALRYLSIIIIKVNSFP